ncbi:MAG: exo-alpha-sialidase, partial [Frankiales bacterium]|nr:exo-alpha-sialidase [Frankiales bacterium]
GKTWNVNPLGGVPAQDRPWLAADGPCTVYVAYHQLPAFSPFVNAYDTCTVGNGVPVSNGVALDPTHSTQLSLSSFPGLSGSFNKLTVDTSPKSKHRHAIYIPMSLCQVASAPDLVINANSSGCPKGTQYIVAVSTDRGQTFTYHPVALDKSGATLVWAATVATDAAGRVYYTWSDSHNVYLDVSTDGGVHWTKPRQLNGAKTAAVYPTVAGGSAGRVDVAWYGADRKGDSNSSKIMGQPSVKGSVPWKVMLARSTDGGKHFATRAVTGPIHLGELCTHGSGCADTNSRNLLDDFGLVISPTTGHDSITYTADRPDGTAGHAFTGFVSEVGPAKRSSGHGSTGGTHGRHHSSGGRSGASGGSSSGRGLAATGLSPAIALVGLGLLTTGLLLRRRTVR